jgi:catechol 2,3-dioxygenase-like lactoylglutathione lyase family enzyme
LQSGRTAAIDDLQDARALSAADAAYYQRVLGMRSVLTSPLPADGGQPAGVLVLYGAGRPRHFTDADVALAEHFASQAAAFALAPAGVAILDAAAAKALPDQGSIRAATVSHDVPLSADGAAPGLLSSLVSVCRACDSDGALYALRGHARSAGRDIGDQRSRFSRADTDLRLGAPLGCRRPFPGSRLLRRSGAR